MIFKLSHFWIIFLNIFTWILIHLGMSYACTRIPLQKFNSPNRFFRLKKWENDGRFYEKFFRIKAWKEKVPDGARLFRGGFPKKNLEQKNFKYLNTFLLETCRGELTHWLQILPVWVFFLWNVWWAGISILQVKCLFNDNLVDRMPVIKNFCYYRAFDFEKKIYIFLFFKQCFKIALAL